MERTQRRPAAIGRVHRLRTRPVRQTLCCLALVGLLALADLSQTGATAAADNQLEGLRTEQEQLLRQDQRAHERLGAAQSPAYVAQRARALGLMPAPLGSALVIVVPTPDVSAAVGGAP